MTLSAVLLTGGLSRRMGSEKATALVRGEPLWRRQLRVLEPLNPESVWLSCRERPTWCPEAVGVILDEFPSRGPLSGIAAMLSCLGTSHLVVLAIDLPRMTSVHLGELWAAASDGVGVVPWNQQHFEPLAAIYPREAAQLAQRALETGDFSIQHFASSLITAGRARPYPLTPALRDLYYNANTPEDLAQA